MEIDQAAHLHLRAATRHDHEAAEASAVMRSLMDGQLSASGYRGLLRAQLEIHRRWEHARQAWLDDEVAAGGWVYRSRIPALLADLQQTVSELAPVSTLACPPQSSAAWGELYVVEGASLGGQVIARQLRDRFPAAAHHFFELGKHAPSGYWRRFQQVLDKVLPNAASQHLAVGGAQAMFAHFQRALQTVKP